MDKVLIHRIDLQKADNGRTTYYGGEFTISSGDKTFSYNFYGNDHNESPTQQIIDRIEENFGVIVPDSIQESDNFFEMMYDHLDQGTDLCFVFDENRIVQCVDPVDSIDPRDGGAE